MALPLPFTEHLIMEGYSYAFGITAADIDGDGDLDLVSADAHKGLYWFENDGKGNFTKRIIHDHRHPAILESGRVVLGSKGPKGRAGGSGRDGLGRGGESRTVQARGRPVRSVDDAGIEGELAEG